MLGHLYRCVVRLHPSSFRRRFGDEMLYIFDQQQGIVAALGLMLDGFFSLVRQWRLGPHNGVKLSSAPLGNLTSEHIPSFETFNTFQPRKSAIIHGAVLSLVLFYMMAFGIRYSWIHVLNIHIPEIGAPTEPVEVRATWANDPQDKTIAANTPPTRTLSRDSSKLPEQLHVDVLPTEADDFQGKTIASSSPSTPAELAPTRGVTVLHDPDVGGYISKYPAVKISRINGSRALGPSVYLKLPWAATDPSGPTKSTIRLVIVAPDVALEVIDWGGSGPPLIFLAGLGSTAHIYDNFAPKFVPKYHAYGITRRGFGASSSPAPNGSNYTADQLGDDVLKVIDALGIKKPVLIGHSVAGEELSSIGSRYPGKVAGLIYLDAGYSYALYSPDSGDSHLDAEELQHDLKTFLSDQPGTDQKEIVAKMLAEFPLLQKDFEAYQKWFELIPSPLNIQTKAEPPFSEASAAIIMGEQKYTSVQAPILAIFASPHSTAQMPQISDEKKSEWIALDRAKSSAQAKAFKRLKSAKVVIIPNADHFVFFSNEREVEKDMKDFLSTLN